MKEFLRNLEEYITRRDNYIVQLEQKIESLQLQDAEQQDIIDDMSIRLREVERNINYNN
jgi:predicted transcriptional regulator